MSRKVPFERTTSAKKDDLRVTAIGPTCQQDKLCSSETPNLDMPVIAAILASIEGTKVYPHPVMRDGKGNITRKIPTTNREEKGTEK